MLISFCPFDFSGFAFFCRHNPLCRRGGDRRNQLSVQIKKRNFAYAAVWVTSQCDFGRRHAILGLNVCQHCCATYAHGCSRRADIHAASRRDFSGDKDKTTLDQVERGAVVLGIGRIDQFIDYHSTVSSQCEHGAVYEGDRKLAVSICLNNVVLKNLGRALKCLRDAIGSLNCGLSIQSFDLPNGQANGRSPCLCVLSGCKGASKDFDQIAAQCCAVRCLKVCERGGLKVINDANVFRAGILQN